MTWFNSGVTTCCYRCGARSSWKSFDAGYNRLREMDAAGIDMQVINLPTPGIQPFEAAGDARWAGRTNEELAEVVKCYPNWFVRLASVAPLPTDIPHQCRVDFETMM